MKYILLFLLSLFFKSFVFGEESRPEISDYEIVSNVKDPKLPSNITVYVFQINGLNEPQDLNRIVYSVNKKVDTIYLNDKNQIERAIKPGHYAFQFFHTLKYKEIFIPKLEFKGGYRVTITLNFKLNQRENMTIKKPVIYLYPETETLINVKVNPVGEMSFSYPEYRDGWSVLAQTNGDLTLNNKQYNYLFWEAEQDFYLNDFNFSTGSFVAKENTIDFLELKLNQFGMNSKEQADFIAFWGPQLMRNESNLIHFVVNEDANKFAELLIEPKPKAIYRIYMVFIDANSVKITEMHEQKLPLMDRGGFVVLEWGGVELVDLVQF